VTQIRSNFVRPTTCQLRAPDPTGSVGLAAAPATAVEPKTATLSRLHVTVSRAFMKKLAAAHDALSHSHPGARDADVLETALDLLIGATPSAAGS
jgi:hypothetical protein